jgi:hypothetical protein
MNFLKKIYEYFYCKRKQISPEEITILRKKRMELLPEYSKLMDKKNKGTNIRVLI